ncbi:MAG TPA: lysylphosphatidylglycerol synthase transmembrane domain-containing protein [Chloroflexota bacterium]|nr:lysylphosphatidylglycerol synthase transmembrane domain-containing protein [Chloroflexota bacterium]
MKRWVVWLPWLAAVGLLVWVLRAVPLTAVLETLQNLAWWQLAVLIVLNALALVWLTGRWWLLLWGMGWRLPLGMAVGHRLAAFGVSYFTPGPHFGGEPVQVLLAEKVHGVPRHTAVSAVSLDKSLELLVNFAFLLFGVLITLRAGLLRSGIEEEAIGVSAGLLLVPVGYLAAIWGGRRPLTGTFGLMQPVGKRWRWYETAVDSLAASETQAHQLCRRSPRLFALALLLSAASWLVLLLEYGLMLTFLGAALSPVQIIVAITAMRLAYLLPLPGGLGSLEASQVFALSLMGADPAIGLSASLLIRGRDVLLGLVGLWWGWKMMR